MSHIDDLIAELCPDGVPYSPLGELVRIRNGKDYKSLSHGTIPVYGTGGVMTHISASAHPGPSVLIPRKGSLDKLYYVDSPFWTVDTIFYTEIGDRLVPKFLYFYLLTQRLAELNQAGGVPSLTQSVLNLLRIPVPPLEVQREIVRILDQFTQLEAELEAELEARRRQYEYYRHDVLRFSADVPRKTIGQLAEKISSGRNNSRVEDGAYPVYGSTGKIGATDQPVYGRDALLVARVGANAGRINQVSGKYDVSDNTLIVWPTSDWNLRFAFHQLTDMNLNQYAVGGGQPLVTGRLLKTLEVAVPSMDEQKKVASDLDTFEALVNDLSGGLPAELAARRKQYEYYRDRLLTFKEAPA